MVPTNPVASFNSLIAATSGLSFSSTRPVQIHSISDCAAINRSEFLEKFSLLLTNTDKTIRIPAVAVL
jgi:hypothetical protein